jgi:hypothetical protein
VVKIITYDDVEDPTYGEPRDIVAVETWPQGWDSTWEPCGECGGGAERRRMMSARLHITDSDITEVSPRTPTQCWGKTLALMAVVEAPGVPQAGTKLQLLRWALMLADIAEKPHG